MKHRTILIATLVPSTLLAAAAATAFAEPPPADRNDHVPAVHGGLEIVIAAGTTESVGTVGGGMKAEDLIGSATGVELQLGHRVTPNLTLGFYSSGQAWAEGSVGARHVYSGAAGLEADLHLRPDHAIDPWLSVGGGVRAALIDDDGLAILVGAELARVQLGLDLRVNPDFAIGPVIGASASLYGAERAPMQDFAELTDKGINWTFTGGVSCRFNTLGTRR